MIHGFKGHCPAVGRTGIVVRSVRYLGAFGGFAGLDFAKLRAALDFKLGLVSCQAIMFSRLGLLGREALKASTSAVRSAELTLVVVVLGLRIVFAALAVTCLTRAGFLEAAIKQSYHLLSW